MTGYRGFSSKAEYEAHYSDPANYAAEIPAMKQYTREAEAERGQTTLCPKIGADQWTCKAGECICHLAARVNR